jgi:hypothetical protein
VSLVTFVPVSGCDIYAGWPEKVIGDGFIDLILKYSCSDDSAVYKDGFNDEYEFFGVENGKWTVEIREDG